LNYVPERGDIVWLNFAPPSGHEQRGRLPALVLSPQSYNDKVGLALFCPITGHQKNYVFEVTLPTSSKTKGVILSDHIKSLDWRSREVAFIERAADVIVNTVQRNVQKILLEE